MKNQDVIIFDGNDEVTVSVEDIRALKDKAKLIMIFQSTAIYRDLFKDYLVQGKADQFEYKKVDRAFRLLSDQLYTVFGEDIALHIIANTSLTINLEKNI